MKVYSNDALLWGAHFDRLRVQAPVVISCRAMNTSVLEDFVQHISASTNGDGDYFATVIFSEIGIQSTGCSLFEQHIAVYGDIDVYASYILHQATSFDGIRVSITWNGASSVEAGVGNYEQVVLLHGQAGHNLYKHWRDTAGAEVVTGKLKQFMQDTGLCGDCQIIHVKQMENAIMKVTLKVLSPALWDKSRVLYSLEKVFGEPYDR